MLSGSHVGPLVTDEAGYLGNARWLADTGSWLMDTSPYYRWGYSLLLTPFEWLSDDPGSRFQMVHWLNLVLVASVFPLLYALLRRTRGTRPGVAALASAVGTMLPGVGSADGMAMAENLLIPLYLVTLLALWGFLTGRGAGRWWLGLSVLALWATHRRMVVVLALAIVVMVVGVLSDRRRLRPAVVNAVVLLVGLVAVRVVDGFLLDDRWLRVRRPETFGGGPLGLLGDPGRWDTWVSRVAGQAWYLVAGSYGLALFGVVALVATRSRDMVPAMAGPESREGSRRPHLLDPARLVALFQVAVVAATVALAAVYFTLITLRPDQRVYGRYSEVVLAPVVAAGAAWVLERPWGEVARGALAAAGVAIAGLMVLVLPDGLDPYRGANYAVNQVSAISWLGSESEVPLVGATLAAAGALLALVLLARFRAVAVWLVLVGVAFGAAVVPVERKISDGQAFLNERRTFPMDVSRVGPPGTVAFDIAPARHSYATVLQFWIDGTRIVPWPEGAPPPARWVIAALDAPRVLAAGGRKVFADARLAHALWVLPGPEQRRLSAQGRLLPDDLTDPLPRGAQTGSVALAPGTAAGPVSVERGDHVAVPLIVRHQGVGAPWIDGASYRARGSVRLGVRWYDRAGDQVSFPFERADLSRTLWPGQAEAVAFDLNPVADDGEPLPAGHYTAVITVLQEGIGGLRDVDALRLRVEVT